jgi:hypothetical protein
MTRAITGALREVDPTVAIENVKTMDEIRARCSVTRFG